MTIRELNQRELEWVAGGHDTGAGHCHADQDDRIDSVNEIDLSGGDKRKVIIEDAINFESN